MWFRNCAYAWHKEIRKFYGTLCFISRYILLLSFYLPTHGFTTEFHVCALLSALLYYCAEKRVNSMGGWLCIGRQLCLLICWIVFSINIQPPSIKIFEINVIWNCSHGMKFKSMQLMHMLCCGPIELGIVWVLVWNDYVNGYWKLLCGLKDSIVIQWAEVWEIFSEYYLMQSTCTTES